MIKAVRQNKKTNKWEYDYKDLKGKRKIKKGFNTRDEAERALIKHYEELNKKYDEIMKYSSKFIDVIAINTHEANIEQVRSQAKKLVRK